MPLPRPQSVPRPVPLPSAEDLAKRGVAFERVDPAPGAPVRLVQHGHALGVFPRPEFAGPLLRSLTLCLAVLLALPLRGGERAAENAALLYGIAVVEDWQGRRGKAGEIGPFQMLPRTREDRRRELAARGEDSPSERMLAAAHLEWLRRVMRERGVAPLPFNLALCWNAGAEAALSGRAPVASYDYARRVIAVMEASK